MVFSRSDAHVTGDLILKWLLQLVLIVTLVLNASTITGMFSLGVIKLWKQTQIVGSDGIIQVVSLPLLSDLGKRIIRCFVRGSLAACAGCSEVA